MESHTVLMHYILAEQCDLAFLLQEIRLDV